MIEATKRKSGQAFLSWHCRAVPISLFCKKPVLLVVRSRRRKKKKKSGTATENLKIAVIALPQAACCGELAKTGHANPGYGMHYHDFTTRLERKIVVGDEGRRSCDHCYYNYMFFEELTMKCLHSLADRHSWFLSSLHSAGCCCGMKHT